MAEDNMNPTPSPTGGQNQGGQPTPFEAQPTNPVPTHEPEAPTSATQTIPPTQTAPINEPQHAAGTSVPYATAAHSQAPAPKKGGAKTFLLAFAGALVACAVALGVAFGAGWIGPRQTVTVEDGVEAVDVTTPATEITVEGDDIDLAEVVAQKCLPSVAAIDVFVDSSKLMSSGYGYGYGYGYGQSMGQGTGELVEYSLGSGVVLTADGYILTNNHVVDGGDAYQVTVGGETYEAELVGTDPSSDIAVLKAKDATGLTVMEIGDSDDLVAGEWVMTLGSPFGLEQSVATGIVSNVSRSQIMDSSTSGVSSGETTYYANLIQTDAAINPGNSGGAMVDAEGKLVGINTLITSDSGNWAGVGFAIPVNYAYNLAQQIMDGKTPSHAQLGVSLMNVTPQMAQRYGLDVDEGAYIASVVPDSGAAAAGLQEGDIVVAFNGKAVESASDLMLDVRGSLPGDTVTLTVDRAGTNSEVSVTLGSDEASQAAAQQQQQQQQQTPQNPFNQR